MLDLSTTKYLSTPEGEVKKIDNKETQECVWERFSLNYVSFGDSIAAGHAINSNWENDYGTGSQYGENGNASTAIVPGCYTDLVYQEIINAHPNDLSSLSSFAHSGDRVSDLIRMLDHAEVVKKLSEATFVTVCIGANDILGPALDHLEGYIARGNPALIELAAEVENNLAILNDDSDPESYRALFDRLFEINPDAEYRFMNIYNPIKYLWLEEGKNGFFKPVLNTIPSINILGFGVDETIKDGLLNTDIIQTLFKRVNVLGDWAEGYITQLNAVLANKITEYNKTNLALVDTKLLFEAFPNRPASAEKHYNDLVSIEYTRGYDVAAMNWGRLYAGKEVSDYWWDLASNNVGSSGVDVEGIASTLVEDMVVRVIVPDVDPHPEEYGQYVLSRAFLDSFEWSNKKLDKYTISYLPNGGKTETYIQSILGVDSLPAFCFTKENKHTPKAEEYHFIGWNGSANGSGVSYSENQPISLTNNLYLYAQWSNMYTINYWKIYGHDWEGFYDPATNTGPVTKDDSEYYLRVTVNDIVLPYLTDCFTESGNTSPVRTYSASYGSTLYIQLINKGDDDLGAVYVNDIKVAGDSEYCYYTTTITTNMTMTFTWETKNTALYDPQSYWVCGIYT